MQYRHLHSEWLHVVSLGMLMLIRFDLHDQLPLPCLSLTPYAPPVSPPIVERFHRI